MFVFENETLKITRGDTGTVRLSWEDANGNDTAPTGYTAKLSVKKTAYDKEYVLQKECVNDQFNFTHEDTDKLFPGTYQFDIEIKNGASVATLGPFSLEVKTDITR